MQKLYMKKFNGDISNLAMLSFDNNTIIEIEQDKVKEDDRDKVVLVSDTGEYEVGNEVVKELPREKDENGRDKIISVGGFIEISGKPDKVSKVKKDDKNLMANINQDVPVLRQLTKHYKVIGYVKLDQADTYIALIKKKLMILPFLIPIGVVAVCLVVLTMQPDLKTPISLDDFISGPTEEGTIEIEQAEAGKSENLRIIMNVNPVLENGSMNLMIENNKDSNVLSMVGEVYLLAELDAEGNTVETYSEPIKIGETPLLNPGEKIENVPISEADSVEPGRYSGRVLYTAYEITEDGAMPIGQVAGRINLVVK